MKATQKAKIPHTRPVFEELEDRRLLSINPVSPPFTPDEIRSAYGVDNIKFGAVGTQIDGVGRGETIAVVIRGDDIHIVPTTHTMSTPALPITYDQSDLGMFQQQFPEKPFLVGYIKVVGEDGGARPVLSATPEQIREAAISLEWAHAMAPEAQLELIETDNVDTNIGWETALTAGVAAVGANVVVLPWNFPNNFNIPLVPASTFNQTGVTFVAASGDNGRPAFSPAAYPDVVAVAATDLKLNNDGSTKTSSGTVENIASYNSEIGWSNPATGPTGVKLDGSGSTGVGGTGGSGGGYAPNLPTFASPTYQQGLVIHDGNQIISNNGVRTTPDISFGGGHDTTTGGFVAIVSGAKVTATGTAVSAACIAGLIAVADQGIMEQGGKTSLSSAQTLAAIYSVPRSDYHDITSGYNGYSAGVGYDLVSGLGTPVANQWVADLARSATASQSLATIIGAQLNYEALEQYAFNPITQTYTATATPNYITLTLGTDTLGGVAGVSVVQIFSSPVAGTRGTLVAEAAAAATSAITINGADFAVNSLVVDFSKGNMIPTGTLGLQFNGSAFDGGPQGTSSIALQGTLPANSLGADSTGAWTAEINRPLSPNSGFFELGSLFAINYLNMGTATMLPPILDSTPAKNVSYTVLGNNPTYPINIKKATVIGGVQSTRVFTNQLVNNNQSLFIPVDFVNKTGVTVTDSDGNDNLVLDFSLGNPMPAAGLTFNGGTGVNTVKVNGPGNFTLGANSTVTDTTVGGGGLSLLNEQLITVTGDSKDQYFTVTGWNVPVTIDGGGGADQVWVRQDTSFTVNGNVVTSGLGLNLTLQNIKFLELYNSTSGGTFTVNSWTSGGLYLIGSLGNNNYVIGSPTTSGATGGLDAINGPVYVMATGGANNTVTVHDDLNSGFWDYTVSGSGVTSLGQQTVGFIPRPVFKGITITNFSPTTKTVIKTLTLDPNASGSTFNVTPSTTTGFVINGNTNGGQNPPTSNLLNIIGINTPAFQAAQAPTLFNTNASGASGIFLFASDQSIQFTNMSVGVPGGPTSYTGPVGAINAVAGTAGTVSKPNVNIIDSTTGQILKTFTNVYPAGYAAGVQVALGDVNGDGIPDLIVAPGVGQPPLVKVFSLLTGGLIEQFLAQSSTYNFGIQLAVGDVTGDGKADIITGPMVGPANINVFKNNGGATPFTAYTTSTPTIKAFAIAGYQGGVGGLAVGNVMGHPNTATDPHGVGDIVVGAGIGTKAVAQVFNYSASPTSSAVAKTITPSFSATVTGGLSVAVADVNGDGFQDVVMGAGTGGASLVDVWSGKTQTILSQFTAFTGNGNGAPVRVAIARYPAGVNDILVSQGNGGQSHQLKTFTATGAAVGSAFAQTDSWLQGGINLE